MWQRVNQKKTKAYRKTKNETEKCSEVNAQQNSNNKNMFQFM